MSICAILTLNFAAQSARRVRLVDGDGVGEHAGDLAPLGHLLLDGLEVLLAVLLHFVQLLNGILGVGARAVGGSLMQGAHVGQSKQRAQGRLPVILPLLTWHATGIGCNKLC